MHKIKDSMRIECLGGLGGGKSCILSAIRKSEAAGKGGAITLTPVRDPKTVDWYISLGFESKKDSRFNEFWLSPENAKKLLKGG